VNERHIEREREMKPSNFFLIQFARKVAWSQNLTRFSNACARVVVVPLLFPVAALLGLNRPDMIKAVRDGCITAGDAFVGALSEAAKPFYAKTTGCRRSTPALRHSLAARRHMGKKTDCEAGRSPWFWAIQPSMG
jgi:hypothetical protein